MPISINLLAEAQAAEDLRRRDPVKRTIWLAGFVVALVLIWCLLIQARIIQANSELHKHEAHWKSIEKRHAAITENLKKSAAIERKLAALDRLSTNRFLWGATLNALQQTVVPEVQVVRMKGEQVFSFTEAVKPKPNSKTVAAPASTTERITLTIEAKDWNPSQQNYNKFKQSLAQFPYFQSSLTNRVDALRLISLSKPAFDPSDPLRPFVMFTLEMNYPEVRRNE
jgi:hypothetical protein